MKILKTFILSVISIPIAAQDADYELVTTGMHTIRSETALPVTVVTGEQLRDATRATLGETLAGQPGISNASFGPAVGQTVIRGQQGRRVLTLSNGVANADASGNSADHAVSVEPILADAIEVLRGPSTLLYGGGAIGGVVNVIDNRIPRNLTDLPQFSVESRHDTAADQTTYTGRLDFATGNLAWHLDGITREWNNLDIPGFAIAPEWLDADTAEENTRGFIPNTGGDTQSATAGVSWIFDEGFLGIAANRLDNVYGLPAGAHGNEDEEADAEDHGENIFIDMASTRYDLTGEWRNLTPWIEHVDYRLAYTDYGHAEMEAPGVPATQFSNDSWRNRLQITHTEIGNWHGVFGLQTSNESFGAVGEESFIPVTDISSQGLFLIEDFHGDSVTLEFGARLGRDSYAPDNPVVPDQNYDTFSYSASALWDLSAATSFGLIYSHSERAPSIEELYSNFAMVETGNCVIHFATSACEIGSTGFTEEQSNNLDFTVYMERDSFSLTLTAFHNLFNDYIGLVATGAESDGFPVRAYRQLDARFSGLEMEATFFLNDTWELRVFGDAIDGHLEGNGDAPRMPPSRLGSRLTMNAGSWTAYVSMLHAAKQDEPGIHETETAGYTRWDIGLDYSMTIGPRSELEFFARGRNLADEDIRLSTSTLRGFAPEAGRSLETGFRYRY